MVVGLRRCSSEITAAARLQPHLQKRGRFQRSPSLSRLTGGRQSRGWGSSTVTFTEQLNPQLELPRFHRKQPRCSPPLLGNAPYAAASRSTAARNRASRRLARGSSI